MNRWACRGETKVDIIREMYKDETIRKTVCFIFEAHEGQRDKAGVPYVFHPLHVASAVGKDRDCILTALLHDVLEDTDYTQEDLKGLGISDQVLEALALLTHDPQTSYLEYIQRLKDNPICAAVKKADLEHNMDLGRLNQVTTEDKQRAAKYREAYQNLTDGQVTKL